MVTVAAIQLCSSHNIAENLLSAAHYIREAATHGAALVVLPEMFAVMGLAATDKVDVKEDFKQGKIQTFLMQQAKENKIWIVGGTIPITAEKNKNKVRAASLVINAQGDIVARYDKIHLFDVAISEKEKYEESATTEPGNKIVAIDTPFGKLGLSVCYDVRFPELFRYLFNQGVEIIAIPAAFTVKTGEAHWELLARSRAVENFCYVIGACQGGMHSNGRKTYGHSLIVDPWGTVIAKKDGVESGVITASIDLEKLHDIRRSIPVKQHQRIVVEKL